MTQDDIPIYSLVGPSDTGGIDDLLDGKSSTAARQRLQALIAQWLRMENLVVLTGAGCSVSQGGKVLVKLEDSVLSAVEAAPNLPSSVKPVLAGRRDALASKTAASFEQWLSFIVNACYLTTDANTPFTGLTWAFGAPPPAGDLDLLIRLIGSAIISECSLRFREAATPAEIVSIAPHLAFLSKLVARDSALGRPHLFTLNYDTLFEQALEVLGIQYFDGFTGRASARFDPSVYGLDVYYPGEVAEGRVRRFDKFLHLYKLHGSIHWRVREGEMRAHHPDLGGLPDYLLLTPKQKGNRLKEVTQQSQIAAQSELGGILPTANKFAQTLSMPFAHLFRSLQMRLATPQTFLLILGYGFGDDHVTYIIQAALMNPSLVMLVVEPDPHSPVIERIKRYRDIGKRAFVLTTTKERFRAHPFRYASFDDFATSTMPDVQWLDDFLRLRTFEKQIESSKMYDLPEREA